MLWSPGNSEHGTSSFIWHIWGESHWPLFIIPQFNHFIQTVSFYLQVNNIYSQLFAVEAEVIKTKSLRKFPRSTGASVTWHWNIVYVRILNSNYSQNSHLPHILQTKNTPEYFFIRTTLRFVQIINLTYFFHCQWVDLIRGKT